MLRGEIELHLRIGCADLGLRHIHTNLIQCLVGKYFIGVNIDLTHQFLVGHKECQYQLISRRECDGSHAAPRAHSAVLHTRAIRQVDRDRGNTLDKSVGSFIELCTRLIAIKAHGRIEIELPRNRFGCGGNILKGKLRQSNDTPETNGNNLTLRLIPDGIIGHILEHQNIGSLVEGIRRRHDLARGEGQTESRNPDCAFFRQFRYMGHFAPVGIGRHKALNLVITLRDLDDKRSILQPYLSWVAKCFALLICRRAPYSSSLSRMLPPAFFSLPMS